jgi:hypothetical protein
VHVHHSVIDGSGRSGISVTDGLSNTIAIGEATQLFHTSTSFGPYWGAGTHTAVHGRILQYTPGLVQQCRERLKFHQYFAVGVAGACGFRNEPHGKVHVPLRIEPRGIVEPFKWLLEVMTVS